jgi:hypothetical protein
VESYSHKLSLALKIPAVPEVAALGLEPLQGLVVVGLVEEQERLRFTPSVSQMLEPFQPPEEEVVTEEALPMPALLVAEVVAEVVAD